MALLTFVLFTCLALTCRAKEDSKWVWGEGGARQGGRYIDSDESNPESRYEVFEGPENRPPYHQGNYNPRPPYRPDFHPIDRPGGLYQNRPGFGQGARPDGIYGNSPGILTGPVPSWIKDGPYKQFDKCKCTEKFNCNSPGISYGHCDTGKSYCCYSTKNQVGGPPPSRPIHSPENGILAGPGGPVDFRPQPPHHHPPPRPAYGNYRPGNNYGPIRPINSGENGVLVGPGGPFDRPAGGGGYGTYVRSAKN